MVISACTAKFLLPFPLHVLLDFALVLGEFLPYVVTCDSKRTRLEQEQSPAAETEAKTSLYMRILNIKY